ncbi:CsbD family protein [Alteribacillus sp. JSM 102045]|uniref:CsbD family protein n=1 Tax=Alteribacillus sp. JSM 102045 TaxID=1562101 RepID=UPI0035BFF128
MEANEGWSDKVKGAVNRAKGETKDQLGNAADDPKLQREGKVDKVKGNIQENIGDQKKKDEQKRKRPDQPRQVNVLQS